MRVIRWKNSATGVESLNITATGIYFPVGKTDSSFKLKLSMAAGGQTASVDTVRDSSGSRTGYGAMNVSGTTETKLGAVVSFATGIIVTAISGTLNAILDDEIPVTNFPEWGLGRFPTKEDADAYVYGATVPQGLPATIAGAPSVYRGPGVGWVAQPMPKFNSYIDASAFVAVTGDECLIANSLVTSGYTKAVMIGGIWVPKRGEVLFEAFAIPYIVQATPGIKTQGDAYKPYISPIIPDWLFPENRMLAISINSSIANASGNTGAHLMATITGAAPSYAEPVECPIGVRAFTPSPTGTGSRGSQLCQFSRVGSIIWAPSRGTLPGAIDGATWVASNKTFNAGVNRIYVMAVTSKADDVVTVTSVNMVAL